MTINHEIKGGLARLLATENLIVEHKRCPTASFDIDNRILTLPLWEKASGFVYDMLVAHEVGHALYTPTEWCGKVDFPKSYLNIVEDVRIEKLMKRRYQGLPKTFARGYKELSDDDFFGTKDEDLNKYNLADRINIHYKIGAHAFVPFADNEQVFVDRAANVETFDEAVQLARDIYAFAKEQEEQQEEQETSLSDQSQSGQQDQNGGGEEAEYSDSDLDGGQDSAQGQQQQETEDESDSDQALSQGGGVHNSDEVKTQDNFDQKIEELNGFSGRNINYMEIPQSVNLNGIVADWKEIHDWVDNYQSRYAEAINRSNDYLDVDQEYRKFKNESVKEVNYLVKEFEMRKSADAYARAGVSKTGVLDTGKLHTYMFREDIFKKVTTIPDGKNHGMVFVLDWSGSMASVLLNTLKQLLCLTNFCKKVQIPFEVYAFTNEWNAVRRANANDVKCQEDYYSQVYHHGIKEKEFFISQYFNMMNIISSRSNNRDYERQCLNIWREAYTQDRHTNYGSTHGMGLSGTPLNEAIVSLNYIIPKFKKDNDLQKVNVCILTDGEGCNSAVGKAYSSDPDGEIRKIGPNRIDNGWCLRDRQTGHVYQQLKNGFEDLTNQLIQQVRDRNHGVSVLGFRIVQGGGLTNFIRGYGGWREDYDKLMKDWKKDRSVVIKNPISFTSLYAISNNAVNEDADLDVKDGAGKTAITKAFKKMTKTKQNNKKILTSFSEHIA